VTEVNRLKGLGRPHPLHTAESLDYRQTIDGQTAQDAAGNMTNTTQFVVERVGVPLSSLMKRLGFGVRGAKVEGGTVNLYSVNRYKTGTLFNGAGTDGMWLSLKPMIGTGSQSSVVMDQSAQHIFDGAITWVGKAGGSFDVFDGTGRCSLLANFVMGRNGLPLSVLTDDAADAKTLLFMPKIGEYGWVTALKKYTQGSVKASDRDRDRTLHSNMNGIMMAQAPPTDIPDGYTARGASDAEVEGILEKKICVVYVWKRNRSGSGVVVCTPMDFDELLTCRNKALQGTIAWSVCEQFVVSTIQPNSDLRWVSDKMGVLMLAYHGDMAVQSISHGDNKHRDNQYISDLVTACFVAFLDVVEGPDPSLTVVRNGKGARVTVNKIKEAIEAGTFSGGNLNLFKEMVGMVVDAFINGSPDPHMCLGIVHRRDGLLEGAFNKPPTTSVLSTIRFALYIAGTALKAINEERHTHTRSPSLAGCMCSLAVAAGAPRPLCDTITRPDVLIHTHFVEKKKVDLKRELLGEIRLILSVLTVKSVRTGAPTILKRMTVSYMLPFFYWLTRACVTVRSYVPSFHDARR
jgi:hypothetical protein